ncbi:MAG: threonine ammonia-lyase IlvA [Bacteroidia bacterium]|nr:threonine ammonia-lyase IlvA [Bacteroidia bacterium]
MGAVPTARSQGALLPLVRIVEAGERLKNVALRTPLTENAGLSARYGCTVLLKREDLQVVRSYKLRGAYNRMSRLGAAERASGVACASAGNHAQGVAYSCHALGIPGRIFMPVTTPRQKISRVQAFGKGQVEIVLTGDTYDDAYAAALADCGQTGRVLVHPFNDEEVIAGQGTVGMEIMADSPEPIDYLFVPVGGGGLAAGVGSYFKTLHPGVKLIGVEPAGAPAMHESLRQQQVVRLAELDTFVDGAAVRRVGDLTFEICRQVLDEVVLVPEGKVCTTILSLYNEEAIVVEPAGALAIAALDLCREQIRGKRVACVVSGGNNDIMRMEEIKERSMLYEELKHYFLIRFPQRAGALREFLVNVLGPQDDITHFEYTKKNNRENGPALVGIEVPAREDYLALMERMRQFNVDFELVNDKPMLFNMLV